jgi:hypothetical protein
MCASSDVCLLLPRQDAAAQVSRARLSKPPPYTQDITSVFSSRDKQWGLGSRHGRPGGAVGVESGEGSRRGWANTGNSGRNQPCNLGARVELDRARAPACTEVFSGRGTAGAVGLGLNESLGERISCVSLVSTTMLINVRSSECQHYIVLQERSRGTCIGWECTTAVYSS